MSRDLSRRDIHWGFLAQGLNVGAGFLLLPVVLRYLSPEEVGLYFVFLTMVSFGQLLEFGFQPTLVRSVAYVFAGAQRLDAEGLSVVGGSQALSLDLFYGLLAAAKKIYFGIASASVLLLAGGGTLYLATLLQPTTALSEVAPAWGLFAAGSAVNFYFGYYNGFLQGRGDVTQANQVIVVGRVVMLIAGSTLLASGFGLLGLGVASLGAAVASRAVARRFFWNEGKRKNGELPRPARVRPAELIGVLWPNSRRLGLVLVGTFMITRANVLLAASFLGLVSAGAYGLTFQVLTVLSSVATTTYNLNLPRINAAQIRGERAYARDVFGQALVVAWVLFAVGSALVATFGNSILALMGSHARLLDTALVVAFAITVLLELNHSLFANFITTYNEVPFVRASLLSGVGTIALSTLAIGVYGMGVWGLVLSQAVVQMAYNNWKWPALAAQMSGFSFAETCLAGVGTLRRQLIAARR